MHPYKIRRLFTPLCVALFLISCSSEKQIKTDNNLSKAANSIADKSPPDITLSLSISKKELYVFRGEDTLRSYPVAVGQSKYPTPVGNFKFTESIGTRNGTLLKVIGRRIRAMHRREIRLIRWDV